MTGSAGAAPDEARLQQFIRTHLRTPAQRAVYAALGGSPERPLSVQDIAPLGRVDDYEIDVALRKFAAAGILERVVPEAGPAQYRWRDEMRYLFEAVLPPNAEDVIDPVCGMPVAPESPHVLRDASGQAILFCSLDCLTIFRIRGDTPGDWRSE
jgi:YHS domain-containing protein